MKIVKESLDEGLKPRKSIESMLPVIIVKAIKRDFDKQVLNSVKILDFYIYKDAYGEKRYTVAVEFYIDEIVYQIIKLRENGASNTTDSFYNLQELKEKYKNFKRI